MSSSVQIIGSPNVFSLHFTHSQFSSPSSAAVLFWCHVSSLPRRQHTLKLSPTTSFVLMSLVSTPVKLNSALTAKAGYSFRGISNHPMNECSFASSLSDAISRLCVRYVPFEEYRRGMCKHPSQVSYSHDSKVAQVGRRKSAEFRESREPKPTTATKAPSLVMALGGVERRYIRHPEGRGGGGDFVGIFM